MFQETPWFLWIALSVAACFEVFIFHTMKLEVLDEAEAARSKLLKIGFIVLVALAVLFGQ